MAFKRSRKEFEADLQKAAAPFVLYGTPLPPVDDHSRDDGSFVPVWRQEATDERGRRRLHGAFTGGFSAGYFNTVGSKEGWTPATFTSSRQNRAKDGPQPGPQQRPEDFMDEEDLREAEESRTLATSQHFAGFGTESDARRKAAAVDIFRPVGDTIGAQLLKRMGWRDGQGIGPRVKRAAHLGDDGGSGADADSDVQSLLFAPADVQVVTFERKVDRKGLGYEGEMDRHAQPAAQAAGHASVSTHDDDSDDEPRSLRAMVARKPPCRDRRSGMGAGFLNDDGSDDDDDPYSMGPRISYNKTIGGTKKPKGKGKGPATSANPLVKDKPTFVSRKLANLRGALKRCHDGRLPPAGFVLGDQLTAFGAMTLHDGKYKPPAVPADWKSALSPTPDQPVPPAVASEGDGAPAVPLTANARGELLGEAPLPGKSVFDFLTPAARSRLATASGRQDLPPARGEGPAGGRQPPTLESGAGDAVVPTLDRNVAVQALERGANGWMPYADDEPKRRRYRGYLEIQAGTGHDVNQGHQHDMPARPPGMGREEWMLELHEFVRAAQVFRPVSGLMANRFTSSTVPHGADAGANAASTDTLLSKPKAKPEDPAESAAKMDLFGSLTRSFSSFFPTRLVCKRFNVSMPDVSATTTPGRTTSVNMPAPAASTGSQSFPSFASAGLQHDHGGDSLRSKQHVPTDQPPNPEQRGPVDDGGSNAAQDQQRPEFAVFKAIFGSDDEDDDE